MFPSASDSEGADQPVPRSELGTEQQDVTVTVAFGSGSPALSQAIQFEGESHKLPRATPRWD